MTEFEDTPQELVGAASKGHVYDVTSSAAPRGWSSLRLAHRLSVFSEEAG